MSDEGDRVYLVKDPGGEWVAVPMADWIKAFEAGKTVAAASVAARTVSLPAGSPPPTWRGNLLPSAIKP